MIELLLKALAYSDGLALAAAGITLIYMATGTFNFAHASKFAWGLYVVFAMYALFGGTPYYYIALAAIFSGVLGLILYFSINKWMLRVGADMVTLMMSTLGADLVFYAFINVFADYLTDVYKLSARYFVLEPKDIILAKIGTSPIEGVGPISFGIVLVVILLLQFFLTKTKFGIAMRTTIENPTLARVLGVNPETVYVTSWFIGGALAGLAGGFLALAIAGYPSIGMTLIVPMFTGSIVGGLYSIFGSLLGGFLIGMSEYLGSYYLATYLGGWILAYRPLIPLTIMVITLLVYPEGIGGINWGKIFRRREK